MNQEYIKKAQLHLEKLLTEQLARVEKMKTAEDWVDYSKVKPIVVGVAGGDGIGPYISMEAQRILEFLLRDEVASGKIKIKIIADLTIEKRAEVMKAIPDEVLTEIKRCQVLLKGPTTTPRKGDPWPNVESANVAMRRELDLFANVRPVRIPREGVDWIFFRENTEGEYVLGSKGINVTDDLALDFKVITTQGAERLIRAAFDYAKRNNIPRVTLVTKANVIKTTDGKFLEIGQQIARDYPGIACDDWYVDIVSAKLLDPKRRRDFRVFALPNLYGDILTDEAAEMQGGVGTAGSANIGKRYAMFEAIHGSAPRMVQEGRADYADPSSMIRAAAMLLRHIGFEDRANKLDMALDICGQLEKKLVITGRKDGATGRQLGDYLMETMQQADLLERWQRYQ